MTRTEPDTSFLDGLLSKFDLFEPDRERSNDEVLAHARRSCPVARTATEGQWLVTDIRTRARCSSIRRRSRRRRWHGFNGRFRFLHEVMAAVRAAVSPGFAVGIRISDQLAPGGLGVIECAEAVQRLEADGLIDFVNASQGSYYSTAAMLPTHGMGIGSMLPSSAPIAAAATSSPHTASNPTRSLGSVARS